MKRLISTLFMFAVVVLFAAPRQLFAQGDTLRLYANYLNGGPSIDQQIFTDQANNPPAGRVYLLQQTGKTDTVYYYNSNMNFTFNVTLVGKANPITGMLPILAPGFGTNGSSPAVAAQAKQNGITIIYKNLYLTDRNITGAATTTGQGPIRSSADSATIIVDHCILDGAGKTNFIYPNANYNKVLIENCELRGEQWTKTGAGLMYYGKSLPTDTLIIRNCTLFCDYGGAFGGNGYTPYFEFDHNTVFFASGILISTPLMNAVIKNNIFYATSYNGADTTGYLRQIYPGSDKDDQVFGLDSLNATVRSLGYTEADRHITIENNAYYWPKPLIDFLDTLHSDTGSAIVPPMWMDSFAKNMFSDKTAWPYCVAKNNWNIDPGFNSSYTTDVLDSLIPFLRDYWEGGGTSYHNWTLFYNGASRLIDSLYLANVPSDWATKQGYPVEENLKYSNASLYYAGTDGKAVGDLNWFPNQLNSTPPPVPTLVSPNDTSGIVRRATLTWNPSNGATGYEVQVATDTTFSSSSIVKDTSVTGTNVKLGAPLAENTKYYWHVAATNAVFAGGAYSPADSFTTGTGIDAVSESDNGIPRTFALYQNYPNPFNPTTIIRYDVPRSSQVTIRVYDVLGREVTTLVDSKVSPGKYSVDFNGARYASGVYFFRMTAGNYVSIQKMLLLK